MNVDLGPDDGRKPSGRLGLRHVQALMLFFAFMLCFAMTVNMSIAIVVMTDTTKTNSFDWNIPVQSVILSSFFWGYPILQIPAGELAYKFGGKVFTALCVGVNAAVSLVLPACAANGGWQMVCACRIIQGLFQGFLMPAAHNLLAKWAPLDEKSRMGALYTSVATELLLTSSFKTMLIFTIAGAQLGTALQFLSAGVVADLWGWPFIFYLNGILGVIWTIAYAFLGANSPEESKIITEQEKNYIQKSLGHVGGHQKLQTPWRSIATSLPFLSVMVAHCGFKWGYWTLVTEIPTYLQKVFGMNIKANGVLSALPYLAIFLLSFPFGFISDAIINRKWLAVTPARKLFNTIGYFGSALVLIGLAHVPAHQVTAAISLLTVAVGVNAAVYSGNVLGSLDMAPNFAGTLMGISNTIASAMALVAPLVIAVILKDESSVDEWCYVFYLAAAMYCLTNVVYLIFGSSERQQWNEPIATEKY